MHDPPTTVIGLLHVELHIPLCDSLKQKRSVLRPCIQTLRTKLNVAVAETGDQDIWRSAILAVATVSGDKTMVEQTLDKALGLIGRRPNLEVVDSEVEML